MGCLHCCGPNNDAILLFEGRKDDVNDAQEAIDSYKVVLFSKLDCQHCYEAKNILRMAGISYYSYELDMVSSFTAEKVLNELYAMTRTRKLPQIFVDGTYIGGICDLRELRSTRELWELTQVKIPCTKPETSRPIPNYCKNRLQYH